MGRGGRRSGTPGKAYGERTDLNQRPGQVMRVPGQPYGAQAEQVRQQQALPAARQPVPTGPPPSMPARQPTQLIPLDAPTMRPDEPLTAGAPVGPGPGPAPAPVSTVGDLLRELSGSSPEVADLLDYLSSGGR